MTVTQSQYKNQHMSFLFKKHTEPLFKVGDRLVCMNADILPNNDYGPALIEGDTYTVKEIYVDKDGYQHIDVGIKSAMNFIRCYETQEDLPRGDQIQWCHAGRFAKK